ncbi:MAG: hypothetical protein RIS34_1519 [Pseudomonadota bacterium]
MHLLIPFACVSAPDAHQALQGLALPHLEKLLGRMSCVHADQADAQSWSPPHERAQARIRGLTTAPPGDSVPCALITPCHWTVNTDHIVMGDPQALGLSQADSQALLAAVRPYFEEDGITLDYVSPLQWLARAELFRGLVTASLDRVAGRNIDPWLPKTAQAAPLRRLQNEMQMLLYTHPVNDARAQSGLQTVNSFWVSGTGAFGPGTPTTPATSASPASCHTTPKLRDAAVREDWAAWAQAWQELDATDCAALLRHVQTGASASLTLCGDRNALTFQTIPNTLIRKIMSLFGHHPLYNLREQL